MRPGPLAPITRPRRKTTPRSYSRRTLIELERIRTARKIRKPQAVDPIDDHRRALFDPLVRFRRPVLPVNENTALMGREIRHRDPALSHQPLATGDRLPPERAVSRAHDDGEE